MNVALKSVDRSNWREMVRLELNPEQQPFVSPPAWSLARCYVRFFGDGFEHLPHLIYAGGQAIGYATTACNPASEDEYWIDDIMIDRRHQGRGYGRAAAILTIRMIAGRYTQCRAVQLTCFRGNTVAASRQTLAQKPVDRNIGFTNRRRGRTFGPIPDRCLKHRQRQSAGLTHRGSKPLGRSRRDVRRLASLNGLQL